MGKLLIKFIYLYTLRIVLGMVNFTENIIDYPHSKEYFWKFLNLIKTKKAMDIKLISVFERCCDNMTRIIDKGGSSDRY